MAKKQGKIVTTPTAPKKAAPKKAPEKKVPAGRTGDINAAYEAAKAKGQGDKFLKNHPEFAADKGASPKPIGRNDTGSQVGERGRFKAIRKPVRKVVRGEEAAELEESQRQIQLQNPEYNTAFGSSQVTYDENGNPVYTETLSEDQQAILDSGESLTQAGQAKATEMLQGFTPYDNSGRTSGYTPFTQTGNEADRARIEEAVYGRLTKNFDRDMAKEKGDLEQMLYNRGIPLDPSNPQYQQHMQAFNDKWQNAKESARGQAVEMGGSELQRSFGMGLQTHQQGMSDTTQLSNLDLQRHQQGLSDMGTLQGMGTGLMVPNMPGYQAPGYETASPAEIDIALRKLKLEQQAVNKAGGGGGGYGGEVPDVNQPPPFQG